MTKHRDDDLGEPGGGERYLPPEVERSRDATDEEARRASAKMFDRHRKALTRLAADSEPTLSEQLREQAQIVEATDLTAASLYRKAATRLDALEHNSKLAADLMRQDSNASAGEAEQKLRRALAATGFLHKSEVPE